MDMASPGELVDVVARALGVPKATVTNHDRNLLKAGLRTKYGRGWAAANITPRDAAHLLTAILASAQVQDSVSSVQRYTETRPHPPGSAKSGFGRIGITELAALPRE